MSIILTQVKRNYAGHLKVIHNYNNTLSVCVAMHYKIDVELLSLYLTAANIA